MEIAKVRSPRPAIQFVPPATTGSRMAREVRSTVIHGLWLMVWVDDQGLARNMIGKLVTRRSEEEVCGQASLNGRG